MIAPLIPKKDRRTDRRGRAPHEERTIVKGYYRGIALRWDGLVSSFLTFVYLGCIRSLPRGYFLK